MARKYKYGYTNDYLQFITWNYRRTVNIANPKIYERLTEEQKSNISQVKSITGVDILTENKAYFKSLPNEIADQRKKQYFDIITGKKLESLFNVAKVEYNHVLMTYSVQLAMEFEKVMNIIRKEDYADFFSKLPSARDLYVAKGYSVNKREEKRIMGEADMAINATRVQTTIEEYKKKYGID